MLRRDHVLANRIWFPFMLMSYILYTESAVMLITDCCAKPPAFRSKYWIWFNKFDAFNVKQSKYWLQFDQFSSLEERQIVFLNCDWSVFNIYAAISVFEPVALAVFERFDVNHLALNSLFYSVIHLTANWKSLTRPERGARRCVSLLFVFLCRSTGKTLHICLRF